ncbi:MAG: hypothetical protein [Enterobacter phage ENC20]|nr:MAG: hypothetical protein [Enterobacter phage ENC20]
MYVINNLRREVNQNFSKALSDWYVTKVSMTTDHIADRFLDRSASVKKDFAIYSEILNSLAKHYSCNVLYYAVKAKNEGMQEVIAYRRINGKVFACAFTVQMFENMDDSVAHEKPVIAVRFRTVIPEYTLSLNTRNAIHVNYIAPKIKFEYDGYRRVMSRLDRLIASKDCPPQLYMLKNI